MPRPRERNRRAPARPVNRERPGHARRPAARSCGHLHDAPSSHAGSPYRAQLRVLYPGSHPSSFPCPLPRAQLRVLYPAASASAGRPGELRPIRSYGQLRRVLDETVSRGYAIEDGEVLEGLASIAVPVPDHARWPIAAIAVTFPREQRPPIAAVETL